MSLERLDLRDKKLLAALDMNARATITDLAKLTGASKQGVEYKLTALARDDIILGYYPVIHSHKLGFIYCRLLITLEHVTREQKDAITAFLHKHPKVFWLFSMHGPYDYIAVLWVKSVSEFTTFVHDFQMRYGAHTKHLIETLGTDVIHYPHRYLGVSSNAKPLHLAETSERVELDDLDRAILKVLCDDARMPLVTIAAKVGASAKVVAYRLKKLEEHAVILGYRTSINHNALGFTYYKVFLAARGGAEDRKHLSMYLSADTRVIYVIEGLGLPADLDIEIMVSSNAELVDFIETLRFKFPSVIGEYQTVIFDKLQKVRYLPF